MTKETLEKLAKLNKKLDNLENIIYLINRNYPLDFGCKKSIDGDFCYTKIIGCDDLIKDLIVKEYNNILDELKNL